MLLLKIISLINKSFKFRGKVLLQAVAPHMMARRQGKIATVCSVNSYLAHPFLAPYVVRTRFIKHLTVIIMLPYSILQNEDALSSYQESVLIVYNSIFRILSKSNLYTCYLLIMQFCSLAEIVKKDRAQHLQALPNVTCQLKAQAQFLFSVPLWLVLFID